MSSPGSRVMTIGLTVMLLSVSAAMHLGEDSFGVLLSVSAAMHLGEDSFDVLLCFVGVLVGTNLVAAGVRMADGPAPIVPVAIGGARALTAFLRRNIAAVGLVMASGAFTAVSGEEDPVLCFGMLILLLLGLTFVNIGARGE